MAGKTTEPLEIVIDTREQAPWAFADEQNVVTRRGTIPAGDYALVGDEAGFAIERKSLADFVATVCTQEERFDRELARMAGMAAKVVVVEAPIAEIFAHAYPNYRIEPLFVMRRVAELTMAGVAVLFADTRAHAAVLAVELLKTRARELGRMPW